MTKKFAAAFFCLLASPAMACTIYSDLELLSPDSDPDIHQVVIKDIWAVWYHPAAYTAADAQKIADRLTQVRCEAVDILGMKDPYSALDGYFTNVMLHTTTGDVVDDGFPDDWENAVGNNDEDYAQMELAEGAPDNIALIDHEGFHIMQDQVDNRYEDSDAFSFWIAEASADWYAWLNDPAMPLAFENAGVIHAAPHLPFWLESDNLPNGIDTGYLVSQRPYAFNSLLAYAQLHSPITKRDITRGYFKGNSTPQEMMVDKLGRQGFATLYADFAAKLTASLIEGEMGGKVADFIMSDAQREEAVWGYEALFEEDEDSGELDPNMAFENTVSLIVDAEDLSTNWSTPEAKYRPYSWGYNVVVLDYPMGTPTLEFQGKNMQLRLVTLVDDVWRIEAVRHGDALTLEPADSAYLVVVYTPKQLGGFGRGDYRLRLQ